MPLKPRPSVVLALLPFLALRALAADGPVQVPLWPNGAPGSEARKDEPEVVGHHDRLTPSVYNIHNPSLTVYLPAAGTATGTALIVAPGGGHQFLSYVHEGTAVADWLSQHGVAGFMLKYRLARDQAGNSPYTVGVDGLADAQRAIRLVRSRAAEWGVDPARIGFLGFSAGGELAMLANIHADPGRPAAPDPVERLSSRPDFLVLGYPGISWEATITKGMPPVFMFSAFDDARTSKTIAALFLKYEAAGVPAEIHIYDQGGHGFGIRKGPRPVSNWPDRLQEWLGDRGLLRPAAAAGPSRDQH
jgi:acetyl esterase/lipase